MGGGGPEKQIDVRGAELVVLQWRPAAGPLIPTDSTVVRRHHSAQEGARRRCVPEHVRTDGLRALPAPRRAPRGRRLRVGPPPRHPLPAAPLGAARHRHRGRRADPARGRPVRPRGRGGHPPPGPGAGPIPPSAPAATGRASSHACGPTPSPARALRLLLLGISTTAPSSMMAAVPWAARPPPPCPPSSTRPCRSGGDQGGAGRRPGLGRRAGAETAGAGAGAGAAQGEPESGRGEREERWEGKG